MCYVKKGSGPADYLLKYLKPKISRNGDFVMEKWQVKIEVDRYSGYL